MKKNKLLLLLALLMTAATGAWADETLLLTIESKDYTDFTSGSKTFDDKVTVTFSSSVNNSGGDNGWLAGDASLLTVAGINGYTITSCKFYTRIGATDGYTVQGESPSVCLADAKVYTDANKSVNIGVPGVTKIEVFGTAPAASSATTVTWDSSIFSGIDLASGQSFTEGDITLTALNGTVYGPGGSWMPYDDAAYKFSTSSGNFTKIEITGDIMGINGSGWTVTGPGAVWTGDANEITFGGYFEQVSQIVFTIAGAAASGYTVSLKDGVKDAGKWTVKVGEGQAQALPIGGLKGDGSETVTLKYNGRLKVKSVTATSDAAPAEPAAIINGKFSVSSTKQVYFSKGNLRYASGAWSFFDNQYDYYATYSADAWDKFGWSNSTNDFGKSTSTNNNDYKNDLVDWGTVPGIGSGWRTLTLAEWQYLFSTRSASTVNSVANARYAKGKVNNVYGIILFPDTYTHPDGVTNPVGINDSGNTGWNGNNYNATDWGKMEAAGCVFLPATGYRQGTSVQSAGISCSYRSSTRYSPSMVQYIYFESSLLNLETHNVGYYGQCVRLVREVTE